MYQETSPFFPIAVAINDYFHEREVNYYSKGVIEFLRDSPNDSYLSEFMKIACDKYLLLPIEYYLPDNTDDYRSMENS